MIKIHRNYVAVKQTSVHFFLDVAALCLSFSCSAFKKKEKWIILFWI